MNRTKDNSSHTKIIKAVQDILCEGSIAVLATIVESTNKTGAKLLIDARGNRTGNLGDDQLNKAVSELANEFLSSRSETKTINLSETRIMLERIEPEPKLVVCGAGHVGAALARLAIMVGYEVTLIDDRTEFVAQEKFSKEINLIATVDWKRDIKNVIGTGRGVSVAIVTRGHKEDELCLRAVMESKPDYVGMIGSKRRTRIVISNLGNKGIDEKLLKDIYAPIGLDIGAVSPEEVALAILAEVVAVRRNGSGRFLSKRSYLFTP